MHRIINNDNQNKKQQSQQNFLKTINYMQPGSRERYQRHLKHQESWLSRVPLWHIWLYGGIAIAITFAVIIGVSNYEWNKGMGTNKPKVAKQHTQAHHSNAVHHSDSLSSYRPVIHVPNVHHFYLPVKLTPSQVTYFNQFYYTDRSRRNYTKLKDVYNARMVKSNQLIKHYEILSKRYAHPTNRHAKYMLAKSNAMIKFFKQYEKYITQKMRRQYPHFNNLVKQGSAQIPTQSHVKPRHTTVYTYHSYGSKVTLPHIDNRQNTTTQNTQPTQTYNYTTTNQQPNNQYAGNSQSYSNQAGNQY